jgi:hypothetical protein
MTEEDRLSLIIEATVGTMVLATGWIVKRGHLELAIEMRDDFMKEWEFPAAVWNAGVAALAAGAKGEEDQYFAPLLIDGGLGDFDFIIVL